MGETRIQDNKASSEPRLHSLSVVGKEGSSDTLRRFSGDPGTTHHSPRPIRTAPPTEGLALCAGVLPPSAGETTPRSLAPWTPVHPPLPPAIDDGLAPGQTTPPVPGGGCRGPGAVTLELSFRSRLSVQARRSLQKPNPAGPALTCQAAAAATASILSLSSCFLVKSASTAPRAVAIGSAGLSPLFLLDKGHVCQGRTGGMWIVFRIRRGRLKRQGRGQVRKARFAQAQSGGNLPAAGFNSKCAKAE